MLDNMQSSFKATSEVNFEPTYQNQQQVSFNDGMLEEAQQALVPSDPIDANINNIQNLRNQGNMSPQHKDQFEMIMNEL